MAMTLLTREQVLDTMRRAEGPDRIAEAERALPAVVDTDGDAKLLARFSLTHNGLVDRLGGSP